MTSNAKYTAANAIGQSIKQNEIVTLPFDQDVLSELIYLASQEGGDWTVNGPVTEFWGCDGNHWRVHMYNE